MEISCAFATSLDTPDHIVIAEGLGYRRAWCYDSPSVYPDVWMMLALAAERTERIGLGPAVLVPSLRHPMVNAAAIAGLAQLAPGRVAVAIGVGFTGRMVLGQRSLKWSDARHYVAAVQALLRGEKVEWEGATIGMIHLPGFVADRPIDVPILLGARGPKGLKVAMELADGIMTPVPLRDQSVLESLPPWRSIGTILGTVLEEGEDPASDHVLETAGPLMAGFYHNRYEFGGDAVDSLPGGRAWREAIEAFPPSERHLAVHEGHLSNVTDRDRPAVREAAPMLASMTFTGTAAELRAKVDGWAEDGYTEVVYQPAGSDIPGELKRMAGALGL